MTSVGRELESEAPWETQKRPPPDWPSKGLVTFDQVSFSYSTEGPLELQNLKAVFRPKEKVGNAGRTGAGKSSLVSALFLLAEPRGKIYIDGVLTSEIGLHDLHKKMSIIPQTDELIQKTIRDKFRECISHRLNTIIDSNRILVLDAGKIHAYDEPYTLLQDPDGIFYKNAADWRAGGSSSTRVLEAAKRVHNSRSHPRIAKGHAVTADGNLVIFETAL